MSVISQKENNISLTLIESKIVIVRGVQVIMDRDLAEMYGVETKYLNRQVYRNINRFPDDFMFQLSNEEFANLRCQNVTSSWVETEKCQTFSLSKAYPCLVAYYVQKSPLR